MYMGVHIKNKTMVVFLKKFKTIVVDVSFKTIIGGALKIGSSLQAFFLKEPSSCRGAIDKDLKRIVINHIKMSNISQILLSYQVIAICVRQINAYPQGVNRFITMLIESPFL